MKKKITTKNGGKGKQAIALIAIAAAAIAIVAGIGVTVAFKKLKRTYERQCCVTDSGEQVEVITGKILPARIYINHFITFRCMFYIRKRQYINFRICIGIEHLDILFRIYYV